MARSFLLLLFTILASCSTTSKPCSKAGDTSWYPPLTGNMECFQRDASDGKRVNHGIFRQFFPNGKVQLTGEFLDGKKTGTWMQYNEAGDLVARRRFENGVEVSH